MLKKVFLILLLIIECFGDQFSSTIHSTNQYTNQLLFYRPYIQTATIKDENFLNIDISESNIFQKDKNLEADFEITTLELTYFYIYSKRVELSFNYPIYYISSGFLDKSLDFIHETLKITTTREHDGHIDNQLNFNILNKISKQHDYFASGNPQLELKYLLYRLDNLYLGINFGIKIPLGDKKDGFTSEKLDYMTTFSLQKNYQSISWLFNIALTYNDRYTLSSEIKSTKMRYFISLATQFKLIKIFDFNFLQKTNFLFTYQYSKAPYIGEDIKFSSNSNMLQFAIRKYTKNDNYIDIFFNQNTIPRHNEADVTFGLSYNFKGF